MLSFKLYSLVMFYMTLHCLHMKLRYGDPWEILIHAGRSELLEPNQYHEKFNFLIVDNRETHITGKLKPLI